MPRSYTTEAVVLRSFRFGEADRVLHLYTLDRGRVGAIAKGVRKTKSRFGGRLEPLSHVGAGAPPRARRARHGHRSIASYSPHDGARTDPYKLQVGLIGLEAMLRLFPEQEANERAFTALTRFLDALDDLGARRRPCGPRSACTRVSAQAALGSGYLPHLGGCVECGEEDDLVGYLPEASGAVCRACARPGTVDLSRDAFAGIDRLLHTPLADAVPPASGSRRPARRWPSSQPRMSSTAAFACGRSRPRRPPAHASLYDMNSSRLPSGSWKYTCHPCPPAPESD